MKTKEFYDFMVRTTEREGKFVTLSSNLDDVTNYFAQVIDEIECDEQGYEVIMFNYGLLLHSVSSFKESVKLSLYNYLEYHINDVSYGDEMTTKNLCYIAMNVKAVLKLVEFNCSNVPIFMATELDLHENGAIASERYSHNFIDFDIEDDLEAIYTRLQHAIQNYQLSKYQSEEVK